MFDDEIVDALESSARVRGDHGGIGERRTASAADLNLWRRSLLRFLNEIDEDATVGDLRRVLEDYHGEA